MEENAMEKKNNDKLVSNCFDLTSIVATAIIAVAVSFIFIFRTVGVNGDSMKPTLHDTDRIILSAIYTEPERGDIVVTCQPNASAIIPDTLVKRVIATGGQTGESIMRTIEAGANAITWTPPSNGEIFKDIMNAYREGKPHP